MLAGGCLSLRELDARCEPEDIQMWRAFYAVEPWGTPTDDRRFGILAAATKGGYWKQYFPGYHPDDLVASHEVIEELKNRDEIARRKHQAKVDSQKMRLARMEQEAERGKLKAQAAARKQANGSDRKS